MLTDLLRGQAALGRTRVDIDRYAKDAAYFRRIRTWLNGRMHGTSPVRPSATIIPLVPRH